MGVDPTQPLPRKAFDLDQRQDLPRLGDHRAREQHEPLQGLGSSSEVAAGQLAWDMIVCQDLGREQARPQGRVASPEVVDPDRGMAARIPKL